MLNDLEKEVINYLKMLSYHPTGRVGKIMKTLVRITAFPAEICCK
jgi:hypothetical protein